jgi:prephenate dehydrogenase
VAAISHLPLAAAAALVNLVAEQPDKDLMTRAAASGWRDTTRVASGDPILGVDMFTTNKVAVLKMLKAFRQSLLDLEKLIKAGEAEKIGEVLAKAKKFRDAIYG